MRGIHFSYTRAGGGRRHHVNEEDVLVVLRRLPARLWERLRVIHFNDRSRGARVAGYVNGGRRDIALCALPARVSLARFLRTGSTPREFGACRGRQWPAIAIRRFMLYDVLLHELGHLQIVDPEAASLRRKYASETKAQELADHWRRRLWAQPFDHPDPVHNRPRPEEFEALARGHEATVRNFDCPAGAEDL